jgi:acetyltransferase-like isoleucine patch superfamily enzyme
VSRGYSFLIRREFKRFEGSRVWWNCRIQNPEFMSLAGATIRSGSWLYAVTGDQTGRTFRPEIVIEEETYLGHNLHLTAVEKVVIERKVMIADSVYISDNYHDYRDVGRAVQDQMVYARGELRVCEGAFVGEGAKVLGHVRVGRNAVIGANAVVTHDVPDFSVAVGIPAKVVRRYHVESARWETE